MSLHPPCRLSGCNDLDYLAILRHSFLIERESSEIPSSNPLVYLSRHFFDFTTYDSKIDELFAAKAIEVCGAINESKTFDYIKDEENYKWFLLMCNMPFFADKLEWGTSVRGAWWMDGISFQSCGLWDGDEQCADEIKFSAVEWKKFISAAIQFSKEETS